MKSFQRFVVLAALSLLFAMSVTAQTTSSLTGTVTTGGAPLPGVTVSIASPVMQGTRTAVTGDSGGYSFPGLTPGLYTMTFELSGMAPMTRRVQVSLSQTSKVDVEMAVTAVEEAITVTASAPATMETPQVSTNFEAEEIEELPIGRTPLAIAALAPGVNTNTASGGQLSISGSPGYDNLVMVNGVVITENVRSQALDLYIEDAIAETTILTGAISAEYGRFTGGVVNSITKSGSNEFSGSIRDNFTNPSWTNRTPFRNPTTGVRQSPPPNVTNEVYEGTLGGRIIRDRLWFFLAGRYSETEGEGETTFTTIPFPTSNEEERIEGKLTGQITPRHTIVASYLDRETKANNSFFQVIMDLDSLTNRVDPQSLLSAHYNGVLTSNFLVEGQYSERKWDVSVGGGSRFTDIIKGTLLLDRSRGNARFNSPTFCGVCDTETRDNEGWVGKGTYYLSTAGLGNHNLVAGLEEFSEHRYANNFQSGSNFRIFVERVNIVDGVFYPVAGNPPASATTPAQTIIRWTPIFEGANENDLTTQSVFLNDVWDLNKYLSFNLGIRYDKNDTVTGNGTKVSDDDAFSPRMTVTYDPFGNGRHRLSASYNRYVSRIIEGPGTTGESTGQPATIDFDYRGPAINLTGNTLTTPQYIQAVFDWFNAQGGTNNLNLLRPGGARSVPGFGQILEGDLSAPVTDEIQLGYGIQIGSNAFAKIDLISREWSDFYGLRVDQSTPIVTTPLGIRTDQGVVGNTDDITREYEAVQFQSRWNPTMLGTRFNLGVTYTYSELTGNDEQESAASGTGTVIPLETYFPEFLGYERRLTEGFLSQDQTHRGRAWIGADLPLPVNLGTINVSVLHNYDSGTPYSLVQSINTTGYTGAPTTTKYVNPPTSGTYYFSDRGEFRFPTIQRTDLALNYSVNLFGLEFFAQGDLLNAFNRDDLVSFNTQVFTTSSTGGFTGLNRFNPFTETPVECKPTGTSCTGQGAHFVKGPLFGRATSSAQYQLPRTIRLSAGFRF